MLKYIKELLVKKSKKVKSSYETPSPFSLVCLWARENWSTYVIRWRSRFLSSHNTCCAVYLVLLHFGLYIIVQTASIITTRVHESVFPTETAHSLTRRDIYTRDTSPRRVVSEPNVKGQRTRALDKSRQIRSSIAQTPTAQATYCTDTTIYRQI